ncbi:cache domain-containing protein [Sulfurospirillum sp. 1307]
MKIIKENNISNIIILSTMIIITTLMIFNGYYFIKKQYDILDRGIAQSRENFIKSQKSLIKREVDAIIDLIRYKRAQFSNIEDASIEEAYKEELKDWIRSIRFGKDKKNYIFVYEIKNFSGGKNFARLLINPNRPDLEGKLISDEYEDANGKKFRKIFLRDINEEGSSFVTYMYKKPGSSDVRPKVSYFRLFPQWDWVIAAGAYLDDIDSQIEYRKNELKRTMQIEVTSAIVIFLLFSLVANAFAIFLGKQIEKYLNSYNLQVKQKTEELKELNKNLENRIHSEIQKSRDQEQLLIQKSKFISLGEMISNIAHQWRQPLSELSAILMTLKFKYNLGKLDSSTMNQKTKEAENILEFMSKTIDDFREFFMPKRDKKEFYILDTVQSVMNIIGTTIKNKNIKVNINIPKEIKTFGHKSEFEQVLLNIITNSKHALVSEKVEDALIDISLHVDDSFLYLQIKDNAGGIKVEPTEKIFEPYFTTKEESGGTGIGLYMSKLIVEKSMGGILNVKNGKNGAIFTIRLKKLI